MAASQDALSDCEGGNVYASLHTGTTAWYILAADSIDPLSGVPISEQLQTRRPAGTPYPAIILTQQFPECLCPGPASGVDADWHPLARPCREARYSCVSRTAVAPSPTAEATRLIER